ncbi:hypothetical protein K9U40_12800 [Xanthobacter autotrophicus]|uniref:hypothetical protein n=1 Tax=Xanthobacter TaxID=279 RepID=UPI0024AC80DD|nr:hypothetical protein [Xanthobacter autotrophicus]MDI4665201.1 hypothetical protein [Xanthobacter autotrophicus]
MRAGPAAISAFLLAALAMPAPPVGAQCALEASQAPSLPAGPAGREVAAARETRAGMITPGATRSRLGHATEVLAVQAGSPLKLTRPDAYVPYQARPPGAPPLRSEEVAASLVARGFVDVSAVRQRGRSFLAEATGPRGERVRLVLDADSGEINGMQVIGFRPAAP